MLMTADTVGGVLDVRARAGARCSPRTASRCTLATMGPPLQRRAARARSRRCRAVRAARERLALEWMDEPWDDVARAGDWLLALEAQLQPDVVHLNHFAHGALPFAAPDGGGRALVRAVVVAGGARRRRAGRVGPRIATRVRRGARRRDAVVAPTAAMLAVARRASYGVRRARPWCCPTGATRGRFAPGPQGAASCSPPAACGTRPRTSPRSRRSRRACRWPVRVAGATARPAGRRARRAAGGVQRARRARARRRSPRGWRAPRSTRCRRATSRSACRALEAALCGCALVLGDIPSLREVWGDAALFVAPDDHDGPARRAAPPDRRPGAARHARRARPGARGLRFTPDAHGARPTSTPTRRLGRAAVRPRQPTEAAACASSCSATRWCPTGTTATRTSCAASCSELLARGHDVRRVRAARRVEPDATWSPTTGERPLDDFRARLPAAAQPRATTRRRCDLDARARRRRPGARPRVERARARAAHRPAPARRRRATGCCSTTPTTAASPSRDSMAAYDLRHYDGVLAFGDVIRDLYLRAGLGRARLDLARGRRHARVPPAARRGRARATWCGSATGATTSAPRSCTSSCSTRCASSACARACTACATRSTRCARSPTPGIEYGGWLPNYDAPEVFARYRRHGARAAAAVRGGAAGHPDDPRRSRRWPAASRWCRAPWDDAEGLFTPGEDFLVARDGARDARAPARRAARAARWPRAGRARAARRSSRATPARTASTSCWTSTPSSEQAVPPRPNAASVRTSNTPENAA